MNKNDIENAQLGASTLSGFFEQFGEDIYSQVLLEVLFEGLENDENVFIFGQSEQAEGNKIDYSIPGPASQTDQN